MSDEIKNKKLKKPQFPEVSILPESRFEFGKLKGEFVKFEDFEGITVKLIDAQGNEIAEPDLRREENSEVAEMLFKLGVRNLATRNVNLDDGKKVVAEAKAPDRPADAVFMLLDQFNDAALFDYVVLRAEGSPALEAMLSNKYAKPAVPEGEPEPIPTLALPEEAPRLWADRDKGTKAAQFVRETYAAWLEAGVLTRGALKACDKALYHAYHVWVHRHPEDAVPFKDAPPSNFIADPAEAIERYRANARASQSRIRARRGDLSHTPV